MAPRRDHKTSAARHDVYAEITARVIEAMETGTAPWTRPWSSSGSLPRNAISGNPYSGVNPMLLMLTAWERGYKSPQWVTFRQANHLAARAQRAAGRKVEETRPGVFVFADGPDAGRSVGGVSKGQSKAEGQGGTEILFWKAVQSRSETSDGEPTRRLVARTYYVFNLEQCDEHVQAFARAREPAPQAFSPIDVAETICEGFAVTTVHGGDKACYRPTVDEIHMPLPESFVSASAYYAVRFHEMTHATGHASRLGRKGVTSFDSFGSHQYSEEELIAEFGACFLSAEAGIEHETEERSVAYLRTWAAKLRESPRLVVTAAAAAQRAVNHVLGRVAVQSTEADAA